MRRLSVLTMVLTLAGCGALRDAFSAHAEVVGTAAGQTLAVERLADLVGRAPRLPVRPDVLTGVANVYPHYPAPARAPGQGGGPHEPSPPPPAGWPPGAPLQWGACHPRPAPRRAAV